MIDLEKKSKNKKQKEYYTGDYDPFRFLVKIVPMLLFIPMMVLMFTLVDDMAKMLAGALFGDDSETPVSVYSGEVQAKHILDEEYVIFIDNEEYSIDGGDWIEIEEGDFVSLERASLFVDHFFEVEFIGGVRNED